MSPFFYPSLHFLYLAARSLASTLSFQHFIVYLPQIKGPLRFERLTRDSQILTMGGVLRSGGQRSQQEGAVTSSSWMIVGYHQGSVPSLPST